MIALRTSFLVVTLITGALTTRGPAQVVDAPASAPDFSRDIRPLLSNACFACHGPDAKTRKRGLRLDTEEGAHRLLPSGRRAVVPGDVEASELVRRITSDDPEIRMPPADSGKALNAREIRTLRSWIENGGNWARHWSFVTPTRPTAPTPRDASRVRNAIDAFVLDRLGREGLEPNDEARKETLIRRVTFDLIGLPPTLREVDAFVADDQPDAYERLVTRLLASPHYGEHMARYWLDAARYGDTHGYHLDNYRSMWPYRDWVVRAFNTNMPFDRFMTEQLAGDLIPNATNDQKIATGFNRCNVTTAEGGLIAEEYLATYAMDRVETTATVFLGLTARCASCHDHKYDPLTQKEFYELYAFFNSITEEASDKNQAIAPPFTLAPTEAHRSEQARIDDALQSIESRMSAPMPAVDARQAQWEAKAAESMRVWKPLRAPRAISTAGATMRLLPDASILVTGVSPAKDEYVIEADMPRTSVRAYRLEVLPSNEQPDKGVGRSSNSNIVLSAFEVEHLIDGAGAEPEPISLADARAEYSQRDFDIDRAIDGKDETGWAVDGARRALSAVFRPREPTALTDRSRLRFRLRFASRFAQHTIGRFRISVAATDRVAPARSSPWEISGPFAAKNFDEAFTRDFGPEAETDRDVAWRLRKDLVDGKAHLLPGAVGSTYLRRTITAPSERDVTIAIGSDDGFRLWCNGELVGSRKVARAVAPDQDKISIRLRRGSNTLQLKIVNAGGGQGFYYRIVSESEIPTEVALALDDASRSPDQSRLVREHYRAHQSPEWKALTQQRDELRREREQLQKRIPRTMIMQERATPRPAHVLLRGRYDRKGEAVEPDTPGALPPLTKSGARATRLDLAHWLAAPANPLFSRVTVNRLWQQVFGTGLVKTSEDFGAQGEWPSHPRLLDWLATEFRDSGWNVKEFMRLLVTSATYRQSAHATPARIARDPENRLLARGPRFRLDAESIRDQALAVSGLLRRDLGGESVKPYQPPGIWRAVGYTSSNTARFKADSGDKLYRRSVYTFWKRTAAPPSMQIFDAPSREACRVRRERTNTPLQALTLLNDVQFVEAARHFAQRMLREAAPRPDARIDWAFRCVTSRLPTVHERRILRAALDAELVRFRGDPAAAKRLLTVGDSPVDATQDNAVLAAYTILGNLLLNLDETITKG